MKNSQLLCVSVWICHLWSTINFILVVFISLWVKDFTVGHEPVLPLSLLVGGSSNFLSLLLKIYPSSNLDVISLERIHIFLDQYLCSSSLMNIFRIKSSQWCIMLIAVFFSLWNTWKIFPRQPLQLLLLIVNGQMSWLNKVLIYDILVQFHSYFNSIDVSFVLFGHRCMVYKFENRHCKICLLTEWHHGVGWNCCVNLKVFINSIYGEKWTRAVH